MNKMKFYKISMPELEIYVEVPEDEVISKGNEAIINQAKTFNMISEAEVLIISSIKEITEEEYTEVVHIQEYLVK